ncbi:MAG: outer membrane beta-barrel protein [Saprospiraceae bacterium]
MKKILFPIFLCLAVAVQAQVQQGAAFIGGTASLSTVSRNKSTQSSLYLQPSIGAFVADQLAIGGTVTLGFGFGDSGDYATFGLSPLVRYYFNSQSNILFFGQAEFDYSYMKYKVNDSSTSGVGAGLGVGVDFFLNPHVALEGILGYSTFKPKNDTYSNQRLGISFGVNAFIDHL